MKLRPLQISTKVRNSTLSAAVTTLLLAIISQTPLSSSPWTRPLKDPAVVGALLTVVGAGAGYLTTEREVSES